jgi:hypothetical protein
MSSEKTKFNGRYTATTRQSFVANIYQKRSVKIQLLETQVSDAQQLVKDNEQGAASESFTKQVERTVDNIYLDSSLNSMKNISS